VFGAGILTTSVLTLLTPLAANAGVAALVAVRVLEGFGEGVTFPAFNAVLACWVPPHDRTRFSTFVYSGALFGTIVSNPVSGYLCSLPKSTVSGCSFCTGWPSVFYLFGTLGLVWYAVWLKVFVSEPEHDHAVTKAELAYIRGPESTAAKKVGAVGERVVKAKKVSERKLLLIQGDSDNSETEPLQGLGLGLEVVPPATSSSTPPWLAIWSSPAVWAIIVGNVVANWSFYNLLTCMPQYLKNVLGLDISSLGFLSSLPYITAFCAAIGTGQLADRARGLGVRTAVVRKTCMTVGLALTSGALLAVAYIPDLTTSVAIALLCLAMVGNGVGNSGWLVNHLDIAPPYAGLLMGISNTFGTVPGFVAPQVTDMITTADPLTQPGLLKQQWRLVFQITAVISGFGAVFFAVFARGDRQRWAGGAE
jgi:MFS family permease